MHRIRWERIILILGTLIVLGFLIHAGAAMVAAVQRFTDSLLFNAESSGVFAYALLAMLLIAGIGVLRLLIRSGRDSQDRRYRK